MIFHDSVQPYGRSVANVGVRQHLSRRSAWELPLGIQFWKAFAKAAVVTCLVTAMLQLAMNGYMDGQREQVNSLANQRHELMDANISLRASRAALLAPQYVELIAGKALSLHLPEAGQVSRYDRKKGRFQRL